MKICAILVLPLAACNGAQATSPTNGPIGRYQVSALSPTEALVIDSATGCLDRVRLFSDHELVTPVIGYQSQDKLRAAIAGTIAGDSSENQNSCNVSHQVSSEQKK